MSTLPFAAFTGLVILAATDWTGLAAFITAIGTIALGAAALTLNRRPPKTESPSPQQQITDAIRAVQDLERCKDERNQLAELAAKRLTEILELQDERGEARRELRALQRANEQLTAELAAARRGPQQEPRP